MSVSPRPLDPSVPTNLQTSEAQPPRPSVLGPAALKAEAERETYHRTREALEHKSVLRGLVLLAAVALLFSLYRAGLSRVFYPGWWRQW